MSFICHIHNYTEYNEEWNVFSAFNPSKCTHLEQWAADCAAPGEQSWTSCRSRDSNPQPWVTSGFKSNALSIRPTTAQLGQRLPQEELRHAYAYSKSVLLYPFQWDRLGVEELEFGRKYLGCQGWPGVLRRSGRWLRQRFQELEDFQQQVSAERCWNFEYWVLS